MKLKEVRQIRNFICFDLEGPLSPQDNAYDLMKLIPDGDKLFEVISRYDDLLTMEGRPGYEPGDTLALIVPFLVGHNISEADITALAAKATLTGGAAELVATIKESGWEVFCITTTYEQYARHITRKLGIPADRVACTKFPLDRFSLKLSRDDAALLQRLEQDILSIAADDGKIKQKLDDFFWKKLPRTRLGAAIKKVKPVGGRRKVAALKKFSASSGQLLSRWVVVGDSITDFRMLKAVNQAQGLAIAFNANQYALPCATMSLASVAISDLAPVLTAWRSGGRDGARQMVTAGEKAGGKENQGYFHWLSGERDLYNVIARHRQIRGLVREAAGKLG
jgi:energy-converting hydrogenase A subunit R